MNDPHRLLLIDGRGCLAAALTYEALDPHALNIPTTTALQTPYIRA